jgi:N-acetylglutamate synthase-like GNAT family acetyltransferase
MPNQRIAYSIRSANASDAVKIAACVDSAYRHYIERIGMPPRPMLDDYTAVIRERQVTIAEMDADVVGVLVLCVTEEGFLLDNVAVKPSHQGTGIGRALLEYAEAEAQRQGFRSLYLYTHERMTENRSLYAKIGYIEYDRRVDKGFSRVYMREQLP